MKREIYLILLGTKRDEPYNKFFSLIINNVPINFVLIYKGKKPNTIIWSIKETYFPNENTLSQEQVLEILKCALREFRWTGYEDTYINGPANVTFDF